MGHFRKSCEGKQRHVTLSAAMAHVRHLKETKGEIVKPYPCFWCKKWHVGRPKQGASDRHKGR